MKGKVFIAEDDTAIMEVMRIILHDAGYEVLGVTDGDNIFEKIDAFSPQLILLDIWMAGEDGGKIAKQLKKQSSTAQVPIIMISANNETEKIAKDVGANGFLQKPFNIDDLIAIVKKHLLPLP